MRADSRRRFHPVLAVLLGLAGLLAGRGPALGQPRDRDAPDTVVVIRDPVHLFGPAAVEEAQKELEPVAKAADVPVLIETVETLRGQSIEDVSLQRAIESGREGLYVLLAKEERKLEVRASRRFRGSFETSGLGEVRDAFVSGLRGEQADDGLRRGVRAIAKVIARLQSEGKLLPRNVGIGRGPLIVRNQARLTLEGARRIIDGAEQKAAEMGLKVNIAVVDDGGHLLSFARMDGARPASGYTATTKAITAATFRQETGPLPKGTTAPDPLLNLSLQNAASASGGRITTLFGGVPVVVDDQVIGGVGVGGGTGEQDATIARAGLAAFAEQLRSAPGDERGGRPSVRPATHRAEEPADLPKS